MRNIIWILLVLNLGQAIAQKKPKIVVGIVVDQMRQDYLYRFSQKMGTDGFNRLLTDGADFRNAHYNYIPTYTAPGHASIYTGTTPSIHGIIGNSWYSKEKKLSTYCVSDLNAKAIGGSARNGQMSPKNLLTTTITDELRLTTNFQAKVIGISIKDRGSILPAGHNPTGAYWFDSKTGNFMTSDYYMDALPTWVEEFNNSNVVSGYLDQTWEPLLPIDQYAESTLDNVAYERPFKGLSDPTFPYDLSKLTEKNGVGLIRTTPFGNSMVMDLALAAIEYEELGVDEVTDFLAVSFSSTDYVGHAFGPNSIELVDTYLRLDLEIARLLQKLDKLFGEDYLVFLTADHGVSNVPLFLEDNKIPGGYSDKKIAQQKISEFLQEEYGDQEWILSVSNNQIFLDQDLIKSSNLDLLNVQEQLKRFLIRLPNVTEAYTAQELSLRNATAYSKKLIENGFNSSMSGDVAVKHKSGFIDGGYGKKGTTHGSGYNYDTNVPVIFYGNNIAPGSYVRKINITDIAPSLSLLLNVSLPSGSSGEPISELFPSSTKLIQK